MHNLLGLSSLNAYLLIESARQLIEQQLNAKISLAKKINVLSNMIKFEFSPKKSPTKNIFQGC